MLVIDFDSLVVAIREQIPVQGPHDPRVKAIEPYNRNLVAYEAEKAEDRKLTLFERAAKWLNRAD